VQKRLFTKTTKWRNNLLAKTLRLKNASAKNCPQFFLKDAKKSLEIWSKYFSKMLQKLPFFQTKQRKDISWNPALPFW
jgi:hypothetical protein